MAKAWIIYKVENVEACLFCFATSVGLSEKVINNHENIDTREKSLSN